jgi:hypothetical protein
VQLQATSGGVLVTWKLAEDSDGQELWRVYSPDDTTVFEEMADRAKRQCIVQASSEAVVNVFVSALNVYGMESQKVQAQGTAATWTGQPPAASPPPGYQEEESGGGDTGYLGHGGLQN